ncbi:MAG TPA: cupin domain-containing protein [Thermomicrobiales bacterium]|nr:cupin domain-containing protein [Thermomicrobiales bacterium]
MAVFAVMERRGAGPPMHRHSRQDELIVVLEGRVTFYRAGERIDGREGVCIVLPRGTEHGYVVESNAARLLIVVAPAERDFEACLAEMSRCTDEPVADLEQGELAIERLISTAAGFGVEITGPRPVGAGN